MERMRSKFYRLLPWITVYFIAMAYLESAVVVYLRALYYPAGFGFPIVPMPVDLVRTEIWREVATMVMLLAPSALVARSALDRFAWFCYGFGVWDIFYYVWLKVLLDWPESLATMDLLFLIPVPWVGPVWAPVLVSIGLIVIGLAILEGRSTSNLRMGWLEWSLLIGGALVIISSFILDPLQQGVVTLKSGASSPFVTYGPGRFPWEIFACGSGLAAVGVMRVLLAIRRSGSKVSPE